MAGFFKNVKAEFKKVIWPEKGKALKQSVAVVVVSVCVGLIIALIDAAVKFGLGFIL
ncbi:MAG: preprotein translocase subunit SecE [Lachnospiraceae bacterium]|nr:preprotein translocase subunit SecE [Lachnospiraceae bacterium]